MSFFQEFLTRERLSVELSSVFGGVSAFLSDNSGSSARAMTLASVAAAALIGIGVGTAAFSTSSTVQTANVAAPAADDALAHALAAALAGETAEAPAPTPAAMAFAAPPTTATTIELPAAPRAAEARREESAASTLAANLMPAPTAAAVNTIDLASAFDTALQHTDDMQNAVFHTADAWLTPLRTNWDAINQAARTNGTVNAFNAVLPAYNEAVVVVRSGDTMMNLLTNLGIDRREAYNAIEAFGEVFDPRRLRVGHQFNVAYQETQPVEQGSADDAFRLVNFSLRTAPDEEVLVRWDDEAEGYVSEARAIDLEERFTRAHGVIDSSLYMAANELGVPDAMTISMIRSFSHSVDFLREIRSGDEFEIYYSQRFDDEGNAVMSGDVIYASLTLRGETERLYRYTTEDDGVTDYFDENGESVRAFLMRTPIDGARITSSFGPRRHPVLGYNRQHKGVDFGASTGTPIYAAGNGTIVRASAYGSYGNYVRIRHVNGYETAYAHMNGYGPGIRSGVRVEQGQIIGYVGATGRVTGAHLHYEVLHNGEQVNPMTIDLPSGRQLEGDVLTAFQEYRTTIDEQMQNAPQLAITATASAGGAINANQPDLSQE